jgi:uncharacterized protein YqjF (DUF2071 family)
LDRLTPTRRPTGRPLLFQRWRALGFLHWPVQAEAVRPLVPPALTIDTYEGQAWVGVVPFTVRGSRVPPLPPLPGLAAFHEINVRTYVHLDGADPGVWFFSLDADSWPVVLGARTLFHLPYQPADITLEADDEAGVSMRGVRGPTPAREARWSLGYRPSGPARPAPADTLEHFLAERYVLYAAREDRLYRGRVSHAPYPLQRAEVTECEETLVAAAGIARAAVPPSHAHYAAGVDVDIFPLERVR